MKFNPIVQSLTSSSSGCNLKYQVPKFILNPVTPRSAQQLHIYVKRVNLKPSQIYRFFYYCYSRVVAIMERNHSRKAAGHLEVFPDGNPNHGVNFTNIL